MKVQTRPARCKQCGLCVAHCPRGAISYAAAPNAAGYKPAAIDDGKCTACGVCYTTCPDGVFLIPGEGA